MLDTTQQLMLSTALLSACLEGQLTHLSFNVRASFCFFLKLLRVLNCIMYSTKKVVGVVTKSRREHLVAQTRELACTQEVLRQVTGRGKCVLCVVCVCDITYHPCVGLDVREVAHDYATAVSDYVHVI